jgi:ATP-dependent DNA ligase
MAGALGAHALTPPSGSGCLHEIKHDGFCIMARRDAAGVRLYTRNGKTARPSGYGSPRIYWNLF